MRLKSIWWNTMGYSGPIGRQFTRYFMFSGSDCLTKSIQKALATGKMTNYFNAIGRGNGDKREKIRSNRYACKRLIWNQPIHFNVTAEYNLMQTTIELMKEKSNNCNLHFTPKSVNFFLAQRPFFPSNFFFFTAVEIQINCSVIDKLHNQFKWISFNFPNRNYKLSIRSFTFFGRMKIVKLLELNFLYLFKVLHMQHN